MSDAVFLRANISSSIYADQVNTAQISGQQAARERTMRAQQEALKQEQTAIQKLEESDKLDINEQERQRNQQFFEADEEEEEQEATPEDDNDTLESYLPDNLTPKPQRVHSIDLTI